MSNPQAPQAPTKTETEQIPAELECRSCGDPIQQGDTCLECDPVYIDIKVDMYIDGELCFDMSQDN